MNFLDRLDNMRVQKRLYALSNNQPYTMNRLVIPFCDNFQDTIDLINTTQTSAKLHLYLKRVKGFFVDRVVDEKIGGRRIFKRNNLKKIYSKIDGECPELKYFYRNISQYRDRNVIYDISLINEIYHDQRITKKDALDEYFKSIIKPRLNVEDYKEKFIVIPVSHDIKYSYGSLRRNDINSGSILKMFLIYLKFFDDIDNLIEIFGDTTIVMISTEGIFKFSFPWFKEQGMSNMSDGLQKILQLMKRIKPKKMILTTDDEQEEENKKEKEKQEKVDEITENIDEENVDEKLPSEVEEAVDKAVDEDDVSGVSEILKDVREKKIERTNEISEERKKYLEDTMNVQVNEKDYEELLQESEQLELEETEFSNVTCIDEFDKNSYVNFNKNYNEKLKEQDIANIAQSFADMDVPLFVQDIKIDGSSTDIDYTEDVKIKFKDIDGETHKVKMRIPKLLDDKFLYLSGTKKNMDGQIVLFPITKVEDKVIITTNYNKLFLEYRGGKYLSPNHSKLKRGIERHQDGRKRNDWVDGIKFGNVFVENFQSGETTREYNQLSKQIKNIEKDNIHITFSLEEAKERHPDFIEEHWDESGENLSKIPLGEIDDNIIVYDKSSRSIESPEEHQGKDLSKFVMDVVEDNFEELNNDIDDVKNVPKTIQYTGVYMLGRWVPLVLLLMYTQGFEYVLESLDIDYQIKPKDEDTSKPRIKKWKEAIIEFEDSYLIYQLDDIEKITMMSYLNRIELSDYKMSDLEDKDKVARIIVDETDSHNFPIYIDNYDNLMIDAITASILAQYSLPTDFSDVLVYSNHLLSTGLNHKDIDIRNARIRHQEIITATLSNVLAEEYEEYSVKKKRGNTTDGFSVPRDAVITKLYGLPNIQEYSTVNPLRNIDSWSTATLKGPSGINEDRAYTAEKRLFDPSFYGKFSMASSYGPGIGVVKHFAVDPQIETARGFMNNVDLDEVDDLDSKHVLSASEAATNLATSHDDHLRSHHNHNCECVSL